MRSRGVLQSWLRRIEDNRVGRRRTPSPVSQCGAATVELLYCRLHSTLLTGVFLLLACKYKPIQYKEALLKEITALGDEVLAMHVLVMETTELVGCWCSETAG